MDWINFLDQNNIPYTTKGPNTKRGEVSVKCPFCGDDDPSEHMGINLASENWGCLRNAEHRGKSAARLVRALLQCSGPQARLVVDQYNRPDPESLDEAIAALQGTPFTPAPAFEPLTLPTQFKRINHHATSRFYQYLKQRGFDQPYAVAEFYRLYCAETGRYKDRLIFTFWDNNNLIGWTGRAIAKTVYAPRYLTSGEAVKQTIFNKENIFMGGHILIVCEGPFDAMKLDWYAPSLNIKATCIFGTSMTMDQAYLINEVSERYNHVFMLFDPEALAASFGARDWLISKNISVAQVPEGIEDPGVMTEAEVKIFTNQLLHLGTNRG